MDWDLYNKRININGSTQRDRNLNTLKINISNKASASLSYKDVLINGLEQNLFIDSGTKSTIKNIKSLPNKSFNLGDIVDFANCKWLITEADSDDEVYVDGKIQECNYLLKYQDENAKIIETWIVSQNAAQYNNGESGNKTIVLGSDQLMLFIPYNTDTVKLRRGKRFFIDNNKVNPMAYKLTRPDTTSFVKNRKGYISLIVTEDVTVGANDRPDLMLCDYIESTTPPVDPSNWIMEIEYLGIPTLKIGGNYKTFTAKLYDNNKNLMPVTPIWTFNKHSSSLDVITTENEIKIKTNNVNLSGEIITLTVTDSHSNIAKSVQLTVVEL